jgi:6-pyruvoyltetrahydropterin/6-carboxytetrahydropterin synthase
VTVWITKEFTFDAAHRIPHHEGKCRELHGHTYRVEVAASGHVQAAGPEAGMVTDFDRIKQVWKAKLEPLLDHRYLNESIGPESNGPGYVEHTTAELIAGWLLTVFVLALRGTCQVDYVRVWETPTSSAMACT